MRRANRSGLEGIPYDGRGTYDGPGRRSNIDLFGVVAPASDTTGTTAVVHSRAERNRRERVRPSKVSPAIRGGPDPWTAAAIVKRGAVTWVAGVYKYFLDIIELTVHASNPNVSERDGRRLSNIWSVIGVTPGCPRKGRQRPSGGESGRSSRVAGGT